MIVNIYSIDPPYTVGKQIFFAEAVRPRLRFSPTISAGTFRSGKPENEKSFESHTQAKQLACSSPHKKKCPIKGQFFQRAEAVRFELTVL